MNGVIVINRCVGSNIDRRIRRSSFVAVTKGVLVMGIVRMEARRKNGTVIIFDEDGVISAES